MTSSKVVSMRLRRIMQRFGQAVSISTTLFAVGLWVIRPPLPGSVTNQAQRFASVILNEFIGTNTYRKNDGHGDPNLVAAILGTFGVPVARPVTILQSQLPTTVPPTPETSPKTSVISTPQPSHDQPRAAHNIVMGWAPADTTANAIKLIQDYPGLTVLSPVWLQLWNSQGALESKADPAVVKYAHAHHIQVWPLVNNQFDGALTHAMLSNPTAQAHFMNQLVKLAVADHFDGINVDFESLQSSDRNQFTHFVGALHKALSAHGIKLSVDITPDIVFLQDTDVYFHAGLAAACDDVVVMAYDEHWGGDSVPGPVADLPWVTTAVDDLLNTGVPADKLILGMPFYTRFWHVTNSGAVSSEAYPASQTLSILKSHQAIGHWVSSLGVAYAKYPKPDGYEEVWYETNATVREKLKLVQDAGLAGVAIWSLGLSDRSTWTTVVHTLNTANPS